MMSTALAQWRIEATMFLPTPNRAIASSAPTDRSVSVVVFSFGDALKHFLQPTVAHREGFVPRKLWAIYVLK